MLFVKIAIFLYITSCTAFEFPIFDFKSELENTLAKDAPESSKCSDALQKYGDALSKKDMWALRMFDATAKLPPGIFAGNIADLGNFDECLEIEENEQQDAIKGKYCLGSLVLDENSIPLKNFAPRNIDTTVLGIPSPRAEGSNFSLTIQWALCAPNHCTAEELNEAFKKNSMPLSFQESMCQSKDTMPELTSGDIAAIAFFAVMLCIMIASTVYDVTLHYKEKKSLYPLLTAFSAFTNGRKLLAVSNNSGQLQCLHGIRFLSMMWVILGHSYIMGIYRPVFNFVDVGEWMKKLFSMYIIGATVSVDTFLFLSGLVMVYSFLGYVEKGTKFNIPMYYIHRYLRLTPALAAAIVVHVTFLKKLSSGPTWSMINLMGVDFCKDYWWSALLYVQNYVHPEEICLGQSWYLSVDMQLFVLSPLVLIPLKRWPKIVLSAVGVLAVATMGAAFAVAWEFNLNGLLAQNQGTPSMDYMKYYYMPTHTRAAPWLIGLILGYIVYQLKATKSRVRINKALNLSLWILSIVTLAVCIFGGNNLVTEEYNKWEHSLYIALTKPAWAIALSWVVFACIFGYGGPINAFLSWSVFQIGGRLTYSMYIVHFTILMMRAFSARLPIYFSDLEMLHIFWGDFWFVVAIAVPWTLLFESPIIIIEKCIFGSGKPASKQQAAQKPNESA